MFVVGYFVKTVIYELLKYLISSILRLVQIEQHLMRRGKLKVPCPKDK